MFGSERLTCFHSQAASCPSSLALLPSTTSAVSCACLDGCRWHTSLTSRAANGGIRYARFVCSLADKQYSSLAPAVANCACARGARLLRPWRSRQRCSVRPCHVCLFVPSGHELTPLPRVSVTWGEESIGLLHKIGFKDIEHHTYPALEHYMVKDEEKGACVSSGLSDSSRALTILSVLQISRGGCARYCRQRRRSYECIILFTTRISSFSLCLCGCRTSRVSQTARSQTLIRPCSRPGATDHAKRFKLHRQRSLSWLIRDPSKPPLRPIRP